MIVYILTSIDVLNNTKIYGVFSDEKLAEREEEKEKDLYLKIGSGLDLKFKIESFKLEKE